MSTRDFDLIVYGATGFTGRLVAEHLLERGDDAMRWAIAGRSAEKLARVGSEIGADDVPVVVADSSDPASLQRMAEATTTVISTVGPYARWGMPVVEACVEAGTDYVDLTGEPQFVRRTVDAHHERARETGARIVHSCGFDSIPSDIGTLVAQTEMQARHGVHATRVRTRVKAMRGGASGGTIASLMGVLDEASADPVAAEVLRDPHSLLPEGQRYGAFTPDRTSATHEDDLGVWTAPFVMEVINARIVRRSNALLDFPWGRDFAYDEAMMMGTGVKGRATATAFAAAFAGGYAAMGVDRLRELLGGALPKAGTGPSAEAREAGFFDIRVIAQHPEDRAKDVTVTVKGDRDPGYGATSRMIGEAGLTLAAGESDAEGGIHTPASALGLVLRDRLEARAGVTFTPA